MKSVVWWAIELNLTAAEKEGEEYKFLVRGHASPAVGETVLVCRRHRVTATHCTNQQRWLCFLSQSVMEWSQSFRWMALNSAPLKSSASCKSSDRPSISDGIHSRWPGARAQACWGPSGRQLWHFKSLSKKMQMISIKGSFFTDMGGREMRAAN